MFLRFGLLTILVALLGCRVAAQDSSSQSLSRQATPTSENPRSTTAASHPEALRVGRDVTAPEAIYAPAPQYSSEARKSCYEGTVVLWLVIDTSGKPQNIKVVRALGKGLDEQAIQAVREWRFKPASKDGRPVAVQINVEVNFRLYDRLSPPPAAAGQPNRPIGVDIAKYPLMVRIGFDSISRSGSECTATLKAIVTGPDLSQSVATSCIVASTQSLALNHGIYPARWKSDQKTLEILGSKGTSSASLTPIDCSIVAQ